MKLNVADLSNLLSAYLWSNKGNNLLGGDIFIDTPSVYNVGDLSSPLHNVYADMFTGALTVKSGVSRDADNINIDIGTINAPFRKIYVTDVVASTISGTSLSGATWQHDASDMTIKSNSAGARVVSVVNQGGGTINLSVYGNIDVTGNVDGVNVSDFYASYTGHNHNTLYVPLTRNITPGNGLAGGGNLSADRTLSVVAASGGLLSVSSSGVSIGNGSAQYQVPVTGASPFTPAYAPLSNFAGTGLSFTGGKFVVGQGSGISVTGTTIAVDSTVARNTWNVNAGNGLTGGGALSSSGITLTAVAASGGLLSVSASGIALAAGSAQYQVPVTGTTPFTPAYTALSTFAGTGMSFAGGQFVIGQGAGLTVSGTTVALTTPGTLTVSSTNSATGSHTHAITNSDNPGQSASILATDATGKLTLRLLSLGLGKILSDSTIALRNTADNAYQALESKSLRNNDGAYTTAASAHSFANTSGVLLAVQAGSVMASNNAAHSTRVPANGIYALGAIRTDVKLTTPLIDSLTSVDMTIAPGGDLYLSPVGSDVIVAQETVIRTSDFTKTILTNGFRIGPTSVSGQTGIQSGSGEFDELRARVFVADETRVDRGQWFLTKSYGILSRAFTAPANIGSTAYIYFENSPHLAAALFTTNDWIMLGYLDMSSGIVLTKVWGQVTAYYTTGLTGEQRWTFTLRQGTGGLVFAKGANAFNFGQTGQGFLLGDAVTATAPNMQVGTWVANPYTPSNYTVLTQMGKLDAVGFTGEYGLAAATAAYGVNDQWIKIATSGAQLNNLPLQFRNSGTQTVDWQSNGSLWIGTSTDKKLEFDAATGQLNLSNSLLIGNGVGFATPALLYCSYDSGDSRYGNSGSANGHLGQPATLVGNPAFRPGRFGGSIEATRAMTNMIANSSFEAESQGVGTNAVGASPTGWSNYSNATGGGTVLGSRLVSNLQSWDGRQCVRIVKDDGTGQVPPTLPSGRIGISRSITVVAGSTYCVSAWVKLGNLVNATSGANQAILYAQSGSGGTLVAASAGTASLNGWQELRCQIVPTTTTLFVYAWLASCDAGEMFIDAVQVTLSYYYPYWPSERANRSASYVSYGEIAGMDWQKFTVSTWFRMADLPTTSFGSNAFIAHIIPAAGVGVYLLLGSSNNRLYGYYDALDTGGITSSRYITTTSSYAITDNNWHHAALVVEYPTMKLYLDGVLVGTQTLIYTASGVPVVHVGANSGGSRPLNGWVDDFAIIPSSLSASEVKQIATGGYPLRVLSSTSELMLSNVNASGQRNEVFAHSGGVFGRVTTFAGTESTSFALINDDSLSEWGGVSNPRTGDVIIGDSRSGGTYLFYDADQKTMLYNGSIVIGTTNKIWLNDSGDGSLAIGGATKASAPFRVGNTGILDATGAIIEGNITASTGTIGGWSITSNQISSGGGYIKLVNGASGVGRVEVGAHASYPDAAAGIIARSTTPTGVVFWAGSSYANSSSSNTPFRVQLDGRVYAKDAIIAGDITANSGTFAGVLTVGASGEIRQGTVTSGSLTGTWPLTGFTGLRIWSDTSIGRIGGYNLNTLQWSAGTDGKLKAGGDNVWLDSTGVNLQPSLSIFNTTSSVKWTGVNSNLKIYHMDYPIEDQVDFPPTATWEMSTTTGKAYTAINSRATSSGGSSSSTISAISTYGTASISMSSSSVSRVMTIIGATMSLSGTTISISGSTSTTLGSPTILLPNVTVSTAALGAYAGKMAITIAGTVRYVPYYAS